MIISFACMSFMASGAAAADGVSGRKFRTFIYSDLVAESTTVMSFETNGNLLIDVYKGFGLYLPLGSMLTGVFSAPNFNENQEDLILVIAGIVITDFLYGTGLAFTDNTFREIFFFSGYAEQ